MPAALEGDVYGAEGTLVLDVRDGFCGWNEGRYEARRRPRRERPCTADDAPSPILTRRVADLAAAYLGGTERRTLADGGRVVEERPGAVALAGRMFATDPPPWCPILF